MRDMIAGSLAFVSLLLAQEPGARQEPKQLAGRVVGAAEDAHVLVAAWHHDLRKGAVEAIGSASADADRKFAFPAARWVGAPDWGSNSVLVVARDGERAIGLLEVRGDAIDCKDLVVPLSATTTFAGVVRGADGKPVAGASIESWSFTLAGERLQRVLVGPHADWRARSDEKGEFVVRGVPAGARVDLNVRHADFATATVYDAPAAARCEVALRPGAVITGTVRLPDGAPAAGVAVTAQLVAPGPVVVRAVTDDAGRYRIASLPEGRFHLWPESDDYTAVAREVRVDAGATREGQDLALVRGGWIVGRVVDAAGSPLQPGAAADVAVQGPARPPRTELQSVKVAREGTFRVRVPAGTNRLYLRPSDGWMEQRGSGVFEVAEGKQTTVEIVVERGSGIREN